MTEKILLFDASGNLLVQMNTGLIDRLILEATAGHRYVKHTQMMDPIYNMVLTGVILTC